MSYGASATRVPARAGGSIADADIFNIGLLCACERGISGVQKEIYSMNDFVKKCGGFKREYMGAYVARSFYAELDKHINVEMKVLMYVDPCAKQAQGEIIDGTGAKVFDIFAAYKGLPDRSEFGNKIAHSITQSENLTFVVTRDAETSSTETILTLNSVDQLKAGYHIKVQTDTTEVYSVIRKVNEAEKTISLDPLTCTCGYGTRVSRCDWSLIVAVKDEKGVYQVAEEWKEFPFCLSDHEGLPAALNDETSGSGYITLKVNTANTSPAGEQVPAPIPVFTPLSGGSDGSFPDDAAWTSLVTGFSDEKMMMLLAPESASVAHNMHMAEFATNGYTCMYMGQGKNRAGEDTLKDLGASLRRPVIFAMIPCDKWISTDDPVTGGRKDIPKIGLDAALWFNTFMKFGESRVAAGNSYEMVFKTYDTLIDNGLIHNDRDGVGERLIEKYSINICRYRRGKGITNNSARTLSTDDGYKYQNQIMQWLLYKKSILSYLETIEQDRSGLRAQESHYNNVWSYMKSKYDAGHLFHGQKNNGELTEFSDVCIIVNDFSVNTLADIAKGIETTFLQFIAPPPIERPVLNLASAPVTVVKA